VRKSLPKEIGIENEVANEDVEACYREIVSSNKKRATQLLRDIPEPESHSGGITSCDLVPRVEPE